jgi:hypothetical protein
MDDIVKHLRWLESHGNENPHYWGQAADEIERLREALRIIGGLKVKDFKQSNYTHYDVCELHENAVHAAKVARAALGEDK